MTAAQAGSGQVSKAPEACNSPWQIGNRGRRPAFARSGASGCGTAAPGVGAIILQANEIGAEAAGADVAREASVAAALQEQGFYWVVLGQNPPEIAHWERGEWWLCGEDRPWQPEAVTVASNRLVFRPGRLRGLIFVGGELGGRKEGESENLPQINSLRNYLAEGMTPDRSVAERPDHAGQELLHPRISGGVDFCFWLRSASPLCRGDDRGPAIIVVGACGSVRWRAARMAARLPTIAGPSSGTPSASWAGACSGRSR